MFFYGYMRQLVNVLAGMSNEHVHERTERRMREGREENKTYNNCHRNAN